MPTRIPMPIPETIRDLLGDLVGRTVGVAKVDTSTDVDEPGAYALADFVTDDDELAACVLADLELTASLGAALTMVPPGIVRESVASGSLEAPTLLENFAEVVNVMARVFNSHDTPHVRWRAVHVMAEEQVPEETQALVDRPAARRDLKVDVEGYGTGRLVVVVL